MNRKRDSRGRFIEADPTLGKKCQWCNEFFYRNPRESYKQWGARKYCDFICFGEKQSAILSLLPSFFKDRKHTAEANQKNRLAHIKLDAITRVRRKDYYILKALERYARIKNAEGRFTLEEWDRVLKENGNKCVQCGISGEKVKLTKDHIIPLTKNGTNYITNIQPLCQSCNSKKSNKLAMAMA